MRLKIIKSLMDGPKNANQLSLDINVNYRTIEHHIRVLMNSNLLAVQGEGYGRVYFPSANITKNFHTLEEILQKAGMKNGRKI